ncbi:hypothetical protein [Lysobacter humi (ex Lee et al. 2017)]
MTRRLAVAALLLALHAPSVTRAQEVSLDDLPDTPMPGLDLGEESNGWYLRRNGSKCSLFSFNDRIGIEVDPSWSPTARVQLRMIDQPLEGEDGETRSLDLAIRPAGGGPIRRATREVVVSREDSAYLLPLEMQDIADTYPTGFDLVIIGAGEKTVFLGDTAGADKHIAALAACAKR